MNKYNIFFETIPLTGDLTHPVADQLATGKYRGREDSAPGDWLARAACRRAPPVDRPTVQTPLSQMRIGATLLMTRKGDNPLPASISAPYDDVSSFIGKFAPQ